MLCRNITYLFYRNYEYVEINKLPKIFCSPKDCYCFCFLGKEVLSLGYHRCWRWSHILNYKCLVQPGYEAWNRNGPAAHRHSTPVLLTSKSLILDVGPMWGRPVVAFHGCAWSRTMTQATQTPSISPLPKDKAHGWKLSFLCRVAGILHLEGVESHYFSASKTITCAFMCWLRMSPGQTPLFWGSPTGRRHPELLEGLSGFPSWTCLFILD